MSPAETLLAGLFAGYPPDERLRANVRAIRKGTPPRDEFFPLTPDGLHRVAMRAVELATVYDVYVAVLPRIGDNGKGVAVEYARTLHADIDQGDGDPWEPMGLLRRSGLPEPDLIVRSGSGESRHAYWFLAELVRLATQEARDRYKAVLRRLCLAIGGTAPGCHADIKSAEIAHVLRVAGTLNHKHDPPTRVTLLADLDGPPPEPHTLTWWRANLPAEPLPSKLVQPQRSRSKALPAGTVTPGLQRWAQTGYPEGNRHGNLTSAAAWLLRDCGLSVPDAAPLLYAKAAASPGRRAITAEELEDMLRWAQR